MREAYALFGRRDDLTSVQDRLLGLDQLEVDATGQVLVYRVENQAVAVWGVPLAAMKQPDPPVVAARNFDGGGWKPNLERFSLACVEMVLSESLCSAPLDLSDNRGLDAAAETLVTQRFARLTIPDYALAISADETWVRWFTGPDVLLRVDGAGLWVRARTTVALDAVRAAPPGEWLMLPDR